MYKQVLYRLRMLCIQGPKVKWKTDYLQEFEGVDCRIGGNAGIVGGSMVRFECEGVLLEAEKDR